MTPITLISSGLTFVVWTLAGFGAGLLLSNRTGSGVWIPLLVLAGVGVGGGLAVRQMLRIR